MSGLEVIGSIASVAQLAGVVYSISKQLYEVGDALSNASSDITDLAYDLEIFSEELLLHATLVNEGNSQYSDQVNRLTAKIIGRCATICVKIDRILKKLRKGGVWVKVKWLYKEKELKKLLDRLRDLKLSLMGTLGHLRSLKADYMMDALGVAKPSLLKGEDDKEMSKETVEDIEESRRKLAEVSMSQELGYSAARTDSRAQRSTRSCESAKTVNIDDSLQSQGSQNGFSSRSISSTERSSVTSVSPPAAKLDSTPFISTFSLSGNPGINHILCNPGALESTRSFHSALSYQTDNNQDISKISFYSQVINDTDHFGAPESRGWMAEMVDLAIKHFSMSPEEARTWALSLPKPIKGQVPQFPQVSLQPMACAPMACVLSGGISSFRQPLSRTTKPQSLALSGGQDDDYKANFDLTDRDNYSIDSATARTSGSGENSMTASASGTATNNFQAVNFSPRSRSYHGRSASQVQLASIGAESQVSVDHNRQPDYSPDALIPHLPYAGRPSSSATQSNDLSAYPPPLHPGFSQPFHFSGAQSYNMDASYSYLRTQEGYPASTGLTPSTMYAESPHYESPDLRTAASNYSTASGPSASSSTMNSPHPIHGHTVPGPEFGLGLTPSIVNYNDYGHAEYNVQPISMNNFTLEFNPVKSDVDSFVDPLILHPTYAGRPSSATQSNDLSSYPPSQNPGSPSFSQMSRSPPPVKQGSQSPYPSSYGSYPYPPPRRPSLASHQSSGSQDGNFSSEEVKEKGRCTWPECGKLFKDLKAHMLTHQNERPEKCSIQTCDVHIKGFVGKHDKNRHTLTHFKGTMVCGFCPGSGSATEKSFKRVDVFKRHLTSVHAAEQTPPNRQKTSGNSKNTKKPSGYAIDSKCSACSGVFSNAQDFYEHLDDCILQIMKQEPKTHPPISPRGRKTSLMRESGSPVSSQQSMKSPNSKHLHQLWWVAFAEMQSSNSSQWISLQMVWNSTMRDASSAQPPSDQDAAQTAATRLQKMLQDVTSLSKSSEELASSPVTTSFDRIVEILEVVRSTVGFKMGALAWVCICTAIRSRVENASVEEIEKEGTILTALADLATLVARYTVMENMYQNWPGMTLEPNYEKSLVSLCVHVLTFLEMVLRSEDAIDLAQTLSVEMVKINEADATCRAFKITIMQEMSSHSVGDISEEDSDSDGTLEEPRGIKRRIEEVSGQEPDSDFYKSGDSQKKVMIEGLPSSKRLKF